MQIEELERLHEAATPVPWTLSSQGATIRAMREVITHDGTSRGHVTTRITFGFDGNAEQRKKDYSLIVALRNGLPAIIAMARERDRLADENAYLRGKIEGHTIARTALERRGSE